MKIIISLLGLFASLVLAAEPAYTWYSGDTAENVYIHPQWIGKLSTDSRVEIAPVTDVTAQQTLRAGKIPAQFPNHTLIFTRTPQGGARMALAGNFTVFFKDGITEGAAESVMKLQGWKVVEKLRFSSLAYVIEAPAGLQSLEAANRARSLPSISAAEPVWWKEVAKK